MSPTRFGRAKNLTLEHDACLILERLAANKKSQGQLISTLLRQEERKREEMRALRERLDAALETALDDVALEGAG